MTLREPLGWNTTSNARHEVKVRDYVEKLRADIGSEIEARIRAGLCDDLYGLGHEIVNLPRVKSLIQFATETVRVDGGVGERADTTEVK